MTLKRRSVFLVVLAVALAAGVYAWRAQVAEDSRPSVMTATVSRGDISQSVQATGTLMPVKLVAVGAQVSGRILSMKVVLGQRVAKGDLIALIDSVSQENALKSSEASLANVRAQKAEKEASLVYAEASLDRRRKTLEGRASSQEDFETAESTVRTTKLQIEALAAQITEAEVAVATARNNLAYTRIVAPMDGTVLSVVTQEGQTVNAAQSAPTIIVLGDLARMTVKTEISEADVVLTKPGQPVSFSILGAPARVYRSTLATIDPAPESIKSDSSISTSTSASSSSSSSSSASSNAIYYYGRFDVDNSDGHLLTYMTAQVDILVASAKDTLLVPSAALGARAADGKRVVRVVGADGAISERRVTVGIDNRVMAQVTDGLDLGDRVVTAERSTAVSTGQRMGPPPMGL